MEKSMRKSDVHPLRGELRAHKLGTILVLAFIVLSAYLNVGSRGAIQGDPTDTPALFIFATIIVVVSGIIVSRGAFADTYDVAARDAQHVIPVSARKRYFAKLWSVMLRHIVPVILANAAFIAACAAVNAASGKEKVDILYSVLQASDILGLGLVADCLTVLTMVCTGTVIAEVIVGFAFCYTATAFWVTAALMEAIDAFFGFADYGEYGVLILCTVIAALVFFAAGTVYVRRDGRHTGKFMAGPAAWEMLVACAVLLAELYLGYVGKTWLIMLALLAVFLVLHFIIFRKDARRELPRAIAIFAAVTLIYIAYALFRYADVRNDFYGKNRNELEAGEYRIEDDDWNNSWWREPRRYTSGPDCELMIGSRVLHWIDSKMSDEYHISNADGSMLNEEQYGKLVEVLRDFCSKNEIRDDSVGDVLSYIFCGGTSKYEGTEFGFQVTVSFGGGQDAHRERCTGYILYEDREPDFLKRIEEAGFVVQQVTNYRR